MLAAVWRSSTRAKPLAGAKALIQRKDGAAAIEFGLVAAPFVALLFALLEAMGVFFAGRLLDVAITQSSPTDPDWQRPDRQHDGERFRHSGLPKRPRAIHLQQPDDRR